MKTFSKGYHPEDEPVQHRTPCKRKSRAQLGSRSSKRQLLTGRSLPSTQTDIQRPAKTSHLHASSHSSLPAKVARLPSDSPGIPSSLGSEVSKGSLNPTPGSEGGDRDTTTSEVEILRRKLNAAEAKVCEYKKRNEKLAHEVNCAHMDAALSAAMRQAAEEESEARIAEVEEDAAAGRILAALWPQVVDGAKAEAETNAVYRVAKATERARHAEAVAQALEGHLHDAEKRIKTLESIVNRANGVLLEAPARWIQATGSDRQATSDDEPELDQGSAASRYSHIVLQVLRKQWETVHELVKHVDVEAKERFLSTINEVIRDDTSGWNSDSTDDTFVNGVDSDSDWENDATLQRMKHDAMQRHSQAVAWMKRVSKLIDLDIECETQLEESEGSVQPTSQLMDKLRKSLEELQKQTVALRKEMDKSYQ